MLIYRYVTVRLVSQYGNLRAIPIGPAAQYFAQIAGAKTLTPDVLRNICNLGLHVMADGSTGDLREMEAQMRAGRAMEHPILIEYRLGAEDELDPTVQSHLDSKMEHGT